MKKKKDWTKRKRERKKKTLQRDAYEKMMIAWRENFQADSQQESLTAIGKSGREYGRFDKNDNTELLRHVRYLS
jgi:hypothetical protein